MLSLSFIKRKPFSSWQPNLSAEQLVSEHVVAPLFNRRRCYIITTSLLLMNVDVHVVLLGYLGWLLFLPFLRAKAEPLFFGENLKSGFRVAVQVSAAGMLIIVRKL